jgi:hypothetical protein
MLHHAVQESKEGYANLSVFFVHVSSLEPTSFWHADILIQWICLSVCNYPFYEDARFSRKGTSNPLQN